MRIVFMGTPEFAVPTLEALVRGGHSVIGVVTQPDMPRGRGHHLSEPPVKKKAVELGIPVYQPARVKAPEFVAVLKELAPDAIVVAAFGQILSKEILTLPKYGCVNVHASLLPKYRGAAPVPWAVIEGEKMSGVTTMLMDEGIDTGDMLERREIMLTEKETAGSLFERLAGISGEVILATLEKVEQGTAVRTPQDEKKSSYAGMLKKTLGEINWAASAESIERLIRGLDPWPSAYTYLNGRTLKLWAADVRAGVPTGSPGRVRAARDGLLVETGDGFLLVTELQLEGKKRMDAADFLRGYPLEEGTVLGR